jgi:O-antigen/teichoic acid export membrane protein
MIKAYFNRQDGHMQEVMKGASSALVIRVFGTLLGFAVSVVIARLLGAEGSGIYYLALSVATIAATIGRVGFDNTVVRFIASHASVNEWSSVRFVYQTAIKVIALSSMLISLILFFSADWMASVFFEKPYMELPFRLAAVAVLPLSLVMIQAQSLRGLKKIPASQWIQTVLISFGTLLLLYPLVGMWGANGAVASYVFSVVITSFVARVLWRKAVSATNGIDNNIHNTLTMWPLFKSSWPLFGVAITSMVMQHAATIFLGVWGSPEEIGVFNVANRVASLLLFPLMAMITILAPKFAAMHRQSDLNGLKRLAHSSSKMLTLSAVPVAIIVAFFAEGILSLFGSDFSDGAWVLIILLAGVVINAITGAVANLLMMSGHEKVVRNITIQVSLLILVMHTLLIPRYGMVGAAIVTSVGMLIQNMAMAWMVQRYLGFFPISISQESHL